MANDPVPQLNDVDSNGNSAVIRDFRSGNAKDGQVGALIDIEPPAVVRDVSMGIVAIDPQTNVLTLNKRFAEVAVRGRIPFVDGGLVVSPSSSLPGGPAQVPTTEPLRSGDFLYQAVLTATGETVQLRAEILANEDVGNVVGGVGPALGLTPQGDDGGSASTVRVRVASLVGGVDSLGNPVSFLASALPEGEDCEVRVHYYQHVAYSDGSATVSDAGRIRQFLQIDPEPPLLDPQRVPIPRGTKIDPAAAVSLQFSEPMDLTVVDALDNFLLSNDSMPDTDIVALLQEPKPSSLSILSTRVVDHQGNGTLLRLVPPLGLFHQQDSAETYWFHMLVGSEGPTDLSGNTVDLADRRLTPVSTFSVDFSLDGDFDDNLVANRLYRFASLDEDGTQPGTEDFFGQFQLRDGELSGAPVTRFSAVGDDQTNLPFILRHDKGECWDSVAMPPVTLVPASGGRLYQFANVINVQLSPPAVFAGLPVPLLYGGLLNPHNPRGSRLQMSYREDDFGLSNTDPSTMMLDIEQMYWAPFRPDNEQYDAFDRVTIEAGHADYRPDVLVGYIPLVPAMPPAPMVPASCATDPGSLNSGLRTTFSDNPLEGTSMVTLVKDKAYLADPNKAFQAPSGTRFMPYATFEDTFTWRDSRKVTWDMASNRAIGLGGAHQPDAQPPNLDRTAHVTSPWIPEGPDPMNPSVGKQILPPGFLGSVWSLSNADFRGDRIRDHDPIALPLLLDFKVYPDDPANGVALGVNKFHIAHVDAQITGYFNPFPRFRVHTSGGITGFGQEVFVDPANTQQATGGWILDAGLGDPTFGALPGAGR